MSLRLNKFIAQALGTSRREADTLIEKNKVEINGLSARLGQQVNPNDEVVVDGKKLTKSNYQYLVFHKPVGYVCSRKQQGENPTIYSLLPSNFHHLKPVGRLDKDSAGILLLTNDGDLAHSMTHPKFMKQKIYTIILDRPLSASDMEAIGQGVTLEDGMSSLKISKVEASKTYQITMHEGRNRQIRRTFGTLGYTVEKLHRTEFGTYSLAKYPLGPGEWQELPPSHLL